MDELGREQRAMGREQRAKGAKRPHWRFEDLEIWQRACDLAVAFHRIADHLDTRRLYRYAEQLRAAGLSLSNNIAEGSGSTHKQELIQFLNIARRSLFEDASMLLVFEKLQLLKSAEVDELLWDCDCTESEHHEFLSLSMSLFCLLLSPWLLAPATNSWTMN
jgi:four helix bundle protein